MKLKDCTFGKMVIDDHKRVGFVVGLTYSVHLKIAGGMSDQELFDRTIPLVKFPDGEQAIHPGNLEPFN